jgi:hypothetical protein
MKFFANWFKPVPHATLQSEADAERERIVLEQKRQAERALAPFIPGQFLFWCGGRCWGGVSTIGQRLTDGCPRCGGPLRFVATALKEPTPIEEAKERKKRDTPPDPKKRNDLAMLTEWRDPMDAA